MREKYLQFFESKGHLRLPSFSLVPNGDKSLLLINSGMAPMKKYFTGEVTPPRNRVTTCQKCIRTPDIERVGITARHGTYFEMLGNFSFGDYFKHEATAWAWEFCTKVLELPVERIWVSIYQDDDEAFDIWTKEVGVDPSRIVRLGKEDNFWEHGTGPCGPCSELYFDRGEEYGCGSPTSGWDATATGTWNFGTWFSPSLITTARETIRPWSIKTSIPVWGWNAWPALCKVWITCSWSIRCRIS